jgi:hypothetical protein
MDNVFVKRIIYGTLQNIFVIISNAQQILHLNLSTINGNVNAIKIIIIMKKKELVIIYQHAQLTQNQDLSINN